MKKIYNYIMLLTLAFVAVCCSEEVIDAPSTNKKGENVQFSLSLNGGSRTIYGPEANDAFPIYWSDADKVLVGSPQCTDGRNSAVYVVTPEPGQSYAQALEHDGNGVAVQWGGDDADFYSVYPGTNASWKTLSEGSVVAKLNIASNQEANIVLNKAVYEEDGTTLKTPSFYSAADMNNVIMYGRTLEKVKNGEVANLQYTPFSTTLEFEVAVGPVGSNNTYGSAKVMSMTLEAPENTNITGDFTLKFNGSEAPTIEAAGNNGNKITMEFTTQPVLNKDNSLKAKMSLIPFSGVASLTGWKVSITVLEGNETTAKTYTKTLTPTEVNDKSDLVPGQIHKIKLPKLTPSAAWTYNTSNWIPALYDYTNIYLTELSLPGAWYAGAKTDDGYQATQSISDLWNAGIRAFAVETKCVTGLSFIGTPKAVPTNVVVSGTADNANLMESEPGTNTLNTGSGTNIYKEGSDNITLKTIFENIISCLMAQESDTEKDPEFAVLVLSYADGGKTGKRPVDYGAWLELIYDSYNSLDDNYKSYIYSSAINDKTTIFNVLNKLIIKINVDANIAKGGYVYQKGLTYTDERTFSYGNNLPALLSYNPYLSQISSGYYATPLFSNMSWKNWDDTDTYRSYDTAVTSGFAWCFTSANRTQLDSGTDTTIPTYANRKEALNAMIEQSKEISESGDHNVWFYFNAGGIQAVNSSDDTSGSDAKTFAGVMNPWLLNTIKLKANGGTNDDGIYVESDPSSIGLVFFNQCTNETYSGPAIIKEIIEMNNKFKLQRYTPTPNPDDNTQEGEDAI